MKLNQTIRDFFSKVVRRISLSIKYMRFKYNRELLFSVITRIKDDSTKELEDFIEAGVDLGIRDKNGNSLLIHAIESKKIGAIRLLLEHNVDSNAEDEEGVTPLMYAITNVIYKAVELLIQFKAKVNATNNFNQSVLMMASTIGKHEDGIKFVNLLLDNGASVNMSDGNSPALIWAVKAKRLETVELLLKKGANVDSKDKENKSVLSIAIQTEDFDLIGTLINAGADTEIIDNTGNTPLMIALKNGYIDIAKILINAGADIEKTDSSGNTPLMIAVENEHEDLVRILIRAGANKDCKNNDGNTALMIATQKNNIEILKALETCVKVDMTRIYNKRLASAVKTNNRAMAERFLIKGAYVHTKVNQDDGAICPSIIAAVESGNIEMVKLLLKYNANVEDKGSENSTALMVAAECGNIEMIRFLLSNLNSTASVDKTNTFGDTPLTLYIKRINYAWGTITPKEGKEAKEAIDLLLSAGYKVDASTLMATAGRHEKWIWEVLLSKKDDISIEDKNAALMLAAGKENKELVALLLSAGANADAVDVKQRTALVNLLAVPAQYSPMMHIEVAKLLLNVTNDHAQLEMALIYAVTYDYREIVESLIAKAVEFRGDADLLLRYAVRTRDLKMAEKSLEKGANANKEIFKAIEQGNLEMVKMLLDHNASIEGIKHHPETPLGCAVRSGHEEIVKLLIERGAQIDQPSGYDKSTPIFLAVKYSHEKVVKLLMDKGANVDIENTRGKTARDLVRYKDSCVSSEINKMFSVYNARHDGRHTFL